MIHVLPNKYDWSSIIYHPSYTTICGPMALTAFWEFSMGVYKLGLVQGEVTSKADVIWDVESRHHDKINLDTSAGIWCAHVYACTKSDLWYRHVEDCMIEDLRWPLFNVNHMVFNMAISWVGFCTSIYILITRRFLHRHGIFTLEYRFHFSEFSGAPVDRKSTQP